MKKLISIFLINFVFSIPAYADYALGSFLDGKISVTSNGPMDFESYPSQSWDQSQYASFYAQIDPSYYAWTPEGYKSNFTIDFGLDLSKITQPSMVEFSLSYKLVSAMWGEYPWQYGITYDTPLSVALNAVSSDGMSCSALEQIVSCSFLLTPSTSSLSLHLQFTDYQIGHYFQGYQCNETDCYPMPYEDRGQFQFRSEIIVTAVPEPQTYALMLAGLAVLLAQGILRRRRIAAGVILALGVASTASHAETTRPSGTASSLMTLSYSVEDLDYSDGVVASASPYSDYTAFSTTGSPTTVLRSLTHDGTGYFWKYVSPTYTDEFFVPKEDADDTYSPNFFFTPAIEQFIVAPNTHISVSINIEQSLNYNCTPCMGATYYVADFEGIYQVTDYWGTYVIGERLQSFGTSALKGLWEPGTSLSKSYTLYYYNFDTSPVLVSLYVGSSALLYVPSTATVTSVPEPQTYALMLAGLAVIGVTMKRRRTGS